MQHLTSQAEALFSRAAALSTELGHNYLGVEHILLAALTRDEAASMQTLEAAGLPPAVFISRLRDEIVRYPRLAEPTGDELPITPRLRKVLSLGSEDRPLGLTNLFEYIAQDSRSLLFRLTGDLDGDPLDIAQRLAGLAGDSATAAGPSDETNLMSTMSIAMYSQHMLDSLVEEMRELRYELRVDNAIVGWLLVREMEGEGQTLNQIFDEDLRPRLEAAMQEHPPGSSFALSLAGDRVDLLIVKGKPED